jgi:uncharacterized membrane protein
MEAQSNSNDRLLAALTYPVPIVGVVILLVESMKNNVALKPHAVQSIALAVALGIALTLLSLIPVVGCVTPLIWLGVTIYYGLQAYNGKPVNIPVVSDFCRGQKWI